MNSFNDFNANKEVIKSLKASLLNRFPQSVLLTGSSGSGKWSLAHMLAKGLLCTGCGQKPCGVCNSCLKVENNSHPDLECIDYEDKEIPVSLARELRQNVYVLPNDSERKVVLIRHAHKLNVSAQNALLKVLEEPPKYAFFILTSENAGSILETIRSRCSKYHLAPPKEQTEFDETYLQNVEGFLKALVSADEYQMLVNSMAFEKLSKEQLRSVLGLIQTSLRDAVLLANGISDNMIKEIGQTQLASRISTEKLIKLYDLIGLLRNRVQSNAAPVIVCSCLCAGAYDICFM